MQSFASAKPQNAPAQSAPARVQPRVGPANDPLEAEADRAADRVMEGKSAGWLTRDASSPLRRKCSSCEAEEDEQIHRKEQGSASRIAPAARAGAAADAVRSGGVPLSTADRAYFEPRFGRDFSNVRLHNHSRAASAAAAIHARAYTWQNDIAFGAGEFSPRSREGRRLIAHELAHVAQQVPHISRQTAPYYTRTFRDDQGGEPLDYTETVQVAPSQTTSGIEGSVNRTVVAPAHGTTPRQVTHTGSVAHIRLTPDCRIVLPYHIFFQPAQQAGSPESCQVPPNSTAVSMLTPAQILPIQNRYLAAVNAGLNNLYGVRVTGCRSSQACTNRVIPVEIAAEAGTAPPPASDIAIDVVNRGGRADSGTICAAGYDYRTAVHEGAHEVLGTPDEYLEIDARTIARGHAHNLAWERPERVRTDLSMMENEYGYGDFTLFHERHFRFAQVFLEAVLQGQGCTVSLEPIRRAPPEFRFDLGLGFGDSNRGGIMSTSLFLGAGLPLDRRRRWMLLLGGQAQAFIGFRNQYAFTAGARAGLEAQTTPARFGVNAGIFGSAGGLYAPGNSGYLPNLPPASERISPYGEIGANLSIHGGMADHTQLRLGVEAAAGREFSNDTNALQWWRLGLVFGISR